MDWKGWCPNTSRTNASGSPRRSARMNEDLEQLLTNLHLRTVAARFDEYLAAADKDGTPFPALLVQLLHAEWQARQESALAALIQRAKMPKAWALEAFPIQT